MTRSKRRTPYVWKDIVEYLDSSMRGLMGYKYVKDLVKTMSYKGMAVGQSRTN